MGDDLSCSSAMYLSRAACCSLDGDNTSRTWVSWVEPATLPWSNCALAFDGTLPFNVVRKDSSTGPLMRGRTAELCPQDAEPHSKTPIIATNERDHRRRIVLHLTLSSGNSKGIHSFSCKATFDADRPERTTDNDPRFDGNPLVSG